MNKNQPPSLVERQCLCGCGKTFKVLPKSTSYYCSITHNPDSKRDLFLFNSAERAFNDGAGVGGHWKIEAEEPEEDPTKEIVHGQT